MEKSIFSWQTKDNLKIHAVHWKAPNPKAVVCLVHGQGEHCERYDHLADFFCKNDYSIMSYDHRGHGKSEGKRGHTPNYDAYLDGVDDLITKARIEYPDLPIFLYGHSMGGNIALNYLIKRKPDVKGIITTGPWIKLAFEPSKFLVTLGKFMRNITPSLSQPTGLDAKHIARNEATVEAYVKDPLVHGKVTSAAGIDLMKAADFLDNYSGELSCPALLMHGEDDQITSAKATEAFAERVSGDITLEIWKGLYHEIHNELVQDEVFQTEIDWLNDKL